MLRVKQIGLVLLTHRALESKKGQLLKIEAQIYCTIFPILEHFFAFAICQKQTNALKYGVINEG